jgi:hypothetical protein
VSAGGQGQQAAEDHRAFWSCHEIRLVQGAVGQSSEWFFHVSSQWFSIEEFLHVQSLVVVK